MKSGDVVKLKSGGPRMTVRAIERDLCDCTWFVYDMQGNCESEPQRYSFPVDVLEVVKDK